jgi:hypothetical protein
MSRLLLFFAALGALILTLTYVSHIGGAGLDLPSYLEGARRLLDQGVPYHPDAFRGPLPMEAEMVTTYRYAPLAAQLAAPLTALPFAVVSTGAFVVLLIAGMFGIAMGARAGGASELQSALVAVGIGGCLPVIGFGAHIGNVSPLFATAVGAALLAPYRGSFATVFVALLKPTALPLLLPLVRDRRLLIAAATAGALIVGLSITISAEAWGAYLQVAANVTLAPATTGYQAIGLGPALRGAGIESFGVVAGGAAAIGAGIAAVHWAPRDAFRSIAAAAVAAAMVNPSASIHGLAPLLPALAARWAFVPRWAQGAAVIGLLFLSWWPAIFGGPGVGLVVAWGAVIAGMLAPSIRGRESLDRSALATEMELPDPPSPRSLL